MNMNHGKFKELAQRIESDRVKSDHTLESLSRETKININILKNLVAAEHDKLPNHTYLRGFIINIYKVMGVDSKDVLELFEEVFEDNNNKEDEGESSTLSSNSFTKREKVPQSSDFLTDILSRVFQTRNIVITLALSSVILIVYLLQNLNQSLEKEVESRSLSLIENQKEKPNEDVSQNNNTLSTKEKENVETKVDSSALESNKTIHVSELNSTGSQNEVLEKSQENNSDVKLDDKVDSKKENLVSQINQEENSTQEKNIAEADKSSSLSNDNKLPFVNFYKPSKPLYSLTDVEEDKLTNDIAKAFMKEYKSSNLSHVLVIASEADSWLSYQVDGGEIKKFILKKGSYFKVRGSLILLFTGNVAGLSIYNDNKEVIASSNSGVKSFVFPLEKAREFKLPLFPSHEGRVYTQEEYIAKMSSQKIEE